MEGLREGGFCFVVWSMEMMGVCFLVLVMDSGILCFLEMITYM